MDDLRATIRGFKTATPTNDMNIDLEAALNALHTATPVADTPYEKRLYKYHENNNKGEPHFLIFRGLQKLNITRLQNELSRYNNDIEEEKSAPKTEREKKRLTLMLRDYATTLRDYEYLTQLIPITGSQASYERLYLEIAFPELGTIACDEGAYRKFVPPPSPPGDKLRHYLKKTHHREFFRKGGIPEELSPFVDVTARFVVMLSGSASLVVPMLIMSLLRVTVVKSLVTTSVAVLLFAAVVSFVFKASNTETVVGTATYAAVLVVFVGTTGSSVG
ncbi:hypothetical protein EJ08DRAFT_256045 [Tothia fuscella]|uniref:DUF6594 domain-containing protein n=1 Tax=Tothia fuscella TaxID=1048955 RepID=A0A9P4NR80_9PEZI|nr:hypothetical protein EJ08DRAFT_256045 [Tothia fuscella]